MAMFWLLLAFLLLVHNVQAFGVVAPISSRRHAICVVRSSSQDATTTESVATESVTTDTKQQDDDDDEEWEYVELDSLSEQDLTASEWLVGTNWDSSPNQIKETWCRLAVNERGQNVAIWGDNAQGKWNFDVASQFLSISKETFGGWGGKKIWAGTVEDYYYLQGTIRGWSPISPASVLGQWQAKRLGVSQQEAGTAPWFEKDYMEKQESVAKENMEKKQQQESDSGIFPSF